jgi:hypothetical protein
LRPVAYRVGPDQLRGLHHRCHAFGGDVDFRVAVWIAALLAHLQVVLPNFAGSNDLHLLPGLLNFVLRIYNHVGLLTHVPLLFDPATYEQDEAEDHEAQQNGCLIFIEHLPLS